MGRRYAARGGLVVALGLVAGQAVGVPVDWKNPGAWRPQGVDAVQPVGVLREAAAVGGRVIVRLPETATAAQREAMKASGMELLAPLGNGAYFARIDAGADAGLLASRVAAASMIRREHKLHADWTAPVLPTWAVLSARSESHPGVSEANPLVAAYVVMHADVEATAPEVEALVRAHAGVVRDAAVSVNALVVEAPLDALMRLADDPRVQWIEPPLPRMGTTNDSNRALVQANEAQQAPYALDGSGVTVFVYDGGRVRASHRDFDGRATVIDSSSTANHATHVAGTIGGSGSVTFNNRGMAPGVSIISAGFEYDGSGVFLYTNPGDAEQDYSAAIAMGADLSNNSIGSNIGPNGFPCAYEGDYGVMAGVIDNIVRGSLGSPITIFWAAGNERGWSCGSGYNTSPPPANNKNAITVGAVNSNNDTMTNFSSWGPSDDGRVRPVIVAPGCQSNGDNGVTSTSSSSDTSYTSMCGTSMASPTAAGVGALVLQDFRANFPSWGDPSNQLMKAFLIHAAHDLGNPGPDYQFGYGSIRAVDTIDFVRTGRFAEAEVDHGGVKTYTVQVAPGDPQLKITAVWDDPAATPNVATALVNDLDLIVTDPNGARHYPWTLNPANPGAPATRDRADHLNNIEQVLVDNPTPGTWLVEIRGHDVPQGPQGVAIAATPTLGPGYLAIGLDTPAPTLLPPGTPLPVRVSVEQGIDTLVPGSVQLSYRTTGGAFQTVAMADLGGGSFEAVVPGGVCGSDLEFFVTAQGDLAGSVSVPSQGAAAPFATEIGVLETPFYDDFSTDLGWSTSAAGDNATSGRWERGAPAGTIAQPSGALFGSLCYVTGAPSLGGDGGNDVDNGRTTLTTPRLDLTGIGANFEISYWRWYSNSAGAAPNADVFTVDISADDGQTWVNVEVVGPTGPQTSGGWFQHRFTPSSLIPLTDRVRMRFIAADEGAGSLVEAALDGFRIEGVSCDALGCAAADIAEPYGSVDFFDLAAYLNLFNAQDAAADLAEPFGAFNFFDVAAYLDLYLQGCP